MISRNLAYTEYTIQQRFVFVSVSFHPKKVIKPTWDFRKVVGLSMIRDCLIVRPSPNHRWIASSLIVADEVDVSSIQQPRQREHHP